jgi:hypothetical protein
MPEQESVVVEGTAAEAMVAEAVAEGEAEVEGAVATAGQVQVEVMEPEDTAEAAEEVGEAVKGLLHPHTSDQPRAS